MIAVRKPAASVALPNSLPHGSAQRQRTARAAADDHPPADEAAHALGGADRRVGQDHCSRGHKRVLVWRRFSRELTAVWGGPRLRPVNGRRPADSTAGMGLITSISRPAAAVARRALIDCRIAISCATLLPTRAPSIIAPLISAAAGVVLTLPDIKQSVPRDHLRVYRLGLIGGFKATNSRPWMSLRS